MKNEFGFRIADNADIEFIYNSLKDMYAEEKIADRLSHSKEFFGVVE